MEFICTMILHLTLGLVIFQIGFFVRKIFFEKSDGRIVIDKSKDEFYVAITTRTEALEKKDLIHLDVVVIEDMSKLMKGGVN